MATEVHSIGVLDNLSGKTVLLRLDFNVPCEKGVVRDDYRIRQSLPTLEFLRSKKAKIVVVSHFEGEGQSLSPVYEYLRKLFPLSFAPSVSAVPQYLSETLPGGVVLLENIRLAAGERENDEALSRQLASLAHLYVNEAFSASHRSHASIVGVPEHIPGYAGFLFEKEVKNLSLALSPASPSLFVLGGAKLETKLPLVKKFITLYDRVFIAGGLIAEVLSARAGQTSEATKGILDVLTHERLLLPSDCIVSAGEKNSLKKISELADGDRIVDVGTAGVEELRQLVASAATVLWNGPLGIYEKGFSEATDRFSEILAESSAHTVIGGGDTVASALKTAPIDSFSFVSTGGGAMLEFLTEGTLAGLTALESSQKKFLNH